MALVYPQYIYGFEVFDSGTAQNNQIDLHHAGGNDWQASPYSYSAGDVIMPSAANASSTQWWKCNTSGTRGSEPTWPASPSPGDTVQEAGGAVVWEFQNYVDTVPAIAAGVYTPDELAAAVASALNAADLNNGYSCSFNYSTLEFTIQGSAAFDLKWSTGAHAGQNSASLLGFINESPASHPWVLLWDYTVGALVVPSGANSNSAQLWKCTTAGTSGSVQPTWPASPTAFSTTQTDGSVTWTYQGTVDKTSATSYVSDTAIAGAYSTGSLWTAAEPLVSTSPVIANAIGSAASLTQRAMNTSQHVSDGATVETVYCCSIRSVQIGFRALLASEQAKMESFLDWIVQGKRFVWQPDKTAPSNGMKLVLANPGRVANMYEWLTRPEVGYGTLTFYEQLS